MLNFANAIKTVAIIAASVQCCRLIYRSFFTKRIRDNGSNVNSLCSKSQNCKTTGKMKRAFASSKPTRMWIDGKCFELIKFNEKVKTLCPESATNSNFEIKTDCEGKIYTSFRLPPFYYKKLTNFPDLKLVENNTNTQIKIPVIGNLIITGDNEESVAEARDEVHSIIGEIRDQTMALQFISIPTKSDEIIANFNKFKEEILSGGEIEGMEQSIFQSPHKLHLTVVVFSLMDETEKSEATKALNDYKNLILDPLIQKTGPIKIRISGINCMETNVKKINVLYANAEIANETDDVTLQKIVNNLSDHFYERGLVRKYQDNVKLHMTLINTKYRKTLESPKKKRWVKRQSFDGTTILQKYKDFHFGECYLNSIHLSLMSSVGEDGFYKPISIINIG